MPKILGASLAEHRAATRDRVFAALVTALADRPFDAITMADLASLAGIGRTALYNHFKDKEAVVVAFACEETERYLAQLREALRAADSPGEQLAGYVRHHVQTANEFHLGFGPDLMALLSMEAVRELRGHVVAVEAVLRQILADGVMSGAFLIADLDATVSLIHATVQARHASADTTVSFVLAAVSAGRG